MSALLKIAQTPRGILEWVNIRGEGKEDLQGNLKYVASLVLDPAEPEAAAFIAKINEFWQENRPKHIATAKSTGMYPHKVKTDDIDEETGKPVMVETGKVVFMFKTDTVFKKDQKPKVIKVFNSKNEVIDLDSNVIGNGSIGRISGAMGMYEVRGAKAKQAAEAGVTLYLDAVKVLKLEKYEAGPRFGDDDAEFEDAWGNSDADSWPEEEASVTSAADEPSKALPRI